MPPLSQLTADVAAAAAAAAPPRRPRASAPARRRPPTGPPPPARRSGRVAGLPPAAHAGGLVGHAASDRALAAPAATYAREAYGPDALRALGTSGNATWTLFVDGYDARRKRVYDQGAAGTTCHQCRQKVRATFTSCAACGSLRGNFCGDCLFMRYGEHVLQARARTEAASRGGGGGPAVGEAAAAEEGQPPPPPPPTSSTPPATTPWACPPCRGLCNCSFHRAAAGLPPTGSLYRASLAAGFPSVAHFLVLSRLTPAGRASLAAAASAGPPGPPPPRAWLAAGPGGEGAGSDDEDEAALATAAGLWARATAAGVLGRGEVVAP